ncbi:ribosome recycling factor family protein, partial [Vibrio parahaemolyticus]|uniref:ribosome recycling factor family protein n=1 Tax=Vibrio parahaemolyticus TaxID=670 RepID=UPI001EFB831E
MISATSCVKIKCYPKRQNNCWLGLARMCRWLRAKTMKETKITISLPSLIHRIGGDHAKRAKTLAAEKQCDLKRIMPSRNW